METGIEKTSLVAIRFQKIGKLYYFDVSDHEDVEIGDYIVVETSRGRELGQVAMFVVDAGNPPKSGWKPIERIATPQDLVMNRMWERRELSALIDCREKAAELGLGGYKFVKAEYSFDGSRLTFLYSSEEEEKADLKELRKALKRSFRKPRVELRQIGPRDAAKVISGLGACGMEERCCSLFLDEFSPISIKMAKTQGISLNPQEITGMCGRLRCCLVYEYEAYIKAREGMPKMKKRVMTPQGVGKVVGLLPLKNTVIVEIESGTRIEFTKDEIEPYDELAALQKKASNP
jgi:cell fate regulator YaaT (PSP1 superfamily)